MFFDQGTPDTSVYMIAGYSIFFLITVIYLVSLVIRARNLRQDLDTLETMEKEAEASAPEVMSTSAPRKAKPSQAKGKKATQTRKRTARKK